MEIKSEIEIPPNLVNQIERFTAQVDALKINTQEQYEVAAIYRKQNKKLIKEVDNTFDPIATKQYAAWKETKSQQKRLKDPLLQRDKILAVAMDDWVAEVKRKAAEEERLRIAERAERQGATDEEVELILGSPVPMVAPPPELKTPGTSLVEDWYFEVVDKAKVPEEFKIINTQMVQQVVNAMKDQTKIPGIVVKHRTKTRQRSR